MQTKTPKLLNDRRDSAAFILAAVSNKSLDDYHGDRVLRRAIERSFEIIGEAMIRLAEHDWSNHPGYLVDYSVQSLAEFPDRSRFR